MTANCKLNSSRILISSAIGRPVHIDVPKSSRTMPQVQTANCCHNGLSKPNCARSRSIASRGAKVPLPAYLSSTTSPGATRSMMKTNSATPNNVGIINSNRLNMYWPIRLAARDDFNVSKQRANHQAVNTPVCRRL